MAADTITLFRGPAFFGEAQTLPISMICVPLTAFENALSAINNSETTTVNLYNSSDGRIVATLFPGEARPVHPPANFVRQA